MSLSKSKSRNGSSPRHLGAAALVESEVDNVQPSQIGSGTSPTLGVAESGCPSPLAFDVWIVEMHDISSL